ncbi:hypothetical protein JZU48_02375, partial [bacterium]|nr:hypothetical protein [bacterium]
GIDAVAGGVDNQFVFIGAAAFTAAGQLRYESNGTTTAIEGNVDGVLSADFRIQVNIANYSFSVADFFL